MQPTRTLFALAAVAGLAAASAPPVAAQQHPLAFGPFQEEPGELELTGRMIARPLQPEAWRLAGLDAEAAERAHAAAVTLLEEWRVAVVPFADMHVLALPEGLDEETMARLLQGTGLYEYATPDWRCYPIRRPNDPLYGNQWQHTKMASEAGWDIHVGDGATIAAWVDTGVDTNHPDLQAALVPGYNSVDDLPQSQGGNVEDINGHGTATGGCIGAIGNNGVGVAGVGWNLKLMPIKTSNWSSGAAYLSDIIEGAIWAVTNGARTASASYSGVSYPEVGTAGTTIKALGGLFLYAAGNEGWQWTGFDYPDTEVIGATDINDNRAWFSSYGAVIDVVAPGDNIYTTALGGGYTYASGTSFSTPMANGICAMVWSANPFLGPNEVESRLFASCDDLGAPGEDIVFGWGRVNLDKAMDRATIGTIQLAASALVAGQQATLTASSASPGRAVYFGYSLDGPGATPVSQLQTSLGILNPVLAGSSVADPGGTAVLTGTVPGSAAGLSVWLQAAQRRNTSNVVATAVQ